MPIDLYALIGSSIVGTREVVLYYICPQQDKGDALVMIAL
jgi:hypothetical protein